MPFITIASEESSSLQNEMSVLLQARRPLFSGHEHASKDFLLRRILIGVRDSDSMGHYRVIGQNNATLGDGTGQPP